MNEEYQKKLTEYVAQFRLPRYRELPDIGLHLEQVTRYASRDGPSAVRDMAQGTCSQPTEPHHIAPSSMAMGPT